LPIDGINDRPPAELIQFRVEKKEHPPNNHRSLISALGKADEDEVQVSSKAQEFLRVRKLVDSLPEVRIDLVNQLAKTIDSGTYSPKAEEIASAIIDKHTTDKLR
jgi:flagellar biosynthesis anti-sigma factor FlgM